MDLSTLRGIFPPILTPLTPDERVDHASLRRLIDFLIASGVHGFWAMGTTGEFASLPEAERAAALETTVAHVAGRVPVIASVGDSSTGLALRHAANAVKAGVDALAATPPHYFPHTQDEVQAHFRALKAAHPDLPLLAYNIPQTVKVNISLATMLGLAREGILAGIKDSQNDLQWFRNLVVGIREAGLEATFRLFVGTRTLIDASVAIGGHGAIPAVSNVAPAQCVEAFEAAVRGDYVKAAAAQEAVMKFEDLAQVARGGSGFAGSISSMKHLLRIWGVIDDATVARPLRGLADAEVEDLRARASLLGAPAALALA
jgi:4-hydroxy-tetrahydrodipicolinate synthase